MLLFFTLLLSFLLGTKSEKCTLPDENSIPGWTVAIYNSNHNVDLCTGTLIAPRVVISSGCCVMTVGNAKNDIYLRSTYREEEVIPLHHNDIIFHPDFDESKPWVHNLAIIFMDYSFANNVPYLCLPEPNQNFVRSHCIETSWGNVKGSGLNMKGELQNQKAEVFDYPCPHKTDGSNLKQIKEQLYNSKSKGGVLCVGGPHYKGFCPGDDGATLACKNPHSNSYVLAGVLAMGSELQVCDKEVKDDSNFFTDVSFNLDWLNRTIPKKYLDEAKGSARPIQLVSCLLVITCLLVTNINH